MFKIYLKLLIGVSALFGLLSACSKAPETKQVDTRQIAAGGTESTGNLNNPAANVTKPEESQISPADGSAIIGKKDVGLNGKPACRIDFVYAGFDPEDLLWDGEACAAVSAKLMDRNELEQLDKWRRLDAFEKQHVSALPGGKVLYVEGEFTASLYPIGTTRLSYEISVAD